MSPTKATSGIVHAEPTKDFFITMLVRDIELVPAIVDLVDNSIDGARRLRPNGNFDGLSVRIGFSQEEFSIADNCGGIPLDIATEYAFRFGRPEKMEKTIHSVGQFGVGMKRALFKLGSDISIRSHTAKNSFEVFVDVPKWRRASRWTFPLTPYKPSRGTERGTYIKVTELLAPVKEEFGYSSFASELVETIKRVHGDALSAGLSITVNGVPISVELRTLFESEDLQPAYSLTRYFEEDPPEATLRLYVGVSESNPNAAGWYVYCNGRLVLGPDQTIVTGWGERSGGTIPKYHNQFARFRGYAFFDCDDASRLPWTTTKTGVDAGHPLYRAARTLMVQFTRPVIDFLNELDREKVIPPTNKRPLEEVVASAEANPRPLSALTTERPFSAPEQTVVIRPPDKTSIQYEKPTSEIELVKKKLKARSASQVGARTFEYFFNRECKK